MPTLGQRLREEREKRGWTIASVAAQTKIQAQYFEAIERDDTGSLPGGFFYRSFVRQYARLLELPESEYERDLERHLLDEQMSLASQPTSLPERPVDVPPLPTGVTNQGEETRRWLLRIGGLVLVVLVCSLVYSVSMSWKTWFGTTAVTHAPEPPAVQAPAPEKKPEPVQAAQTPPVTEPQSEQQAAPAPGSGAAPTPAGPPVTAEQPKPAAAHPAAPPQPAGAKPAVSLTIRATDQVWVQVRDAGKVIYSNVIPVGETRSFSSEGKLRVLFGNAGGVELIYNGLPMPAPGPKGQVRTVEFSATGAEVIVKPPAPEAAKPNQ
ncbi:MAG: helix-turn-helix domain-containing protein [Bryobacteraceae bacterium]|nr:helix-turn-helix domain-containing protein [Bryobacteraceae bacterium]